MIVVAGATGDLGLRIVRALRNLNTDVRALVRPGTKSEKLSQTETTGSAIEIVDFNDNEALTNAVRGATCVVSALSGLREVIVDAQTQLLNAAVSAKVPRFIPSGFAADYLKTPPGENRNFDLRKEFHAILEEAPIRSTTILNGAFADLLTDQPAFILKPIRRVLYWENPNQPLEFTTRDDTAAFTAHAALDDAAPTVLRIAGLRVSAQELAELVSEARGEEYKTLRAGSLATLERLIHAARAVSFDSKALYPPWQAMQYMYSMFSGHAALDRLDNERYGGIAWADFKELLG